MNYSGDSFYSGDLAIVEMSRDIARRNAAERHLREKFSSYMQGDLTAHTGKGTAAEVLFEAIDCAQFRERAMVILAAAAAGRGTQRDAAQLLEEAGAHWSFLNAE